MAKLGSCIVVLAILLALTLAPSIVEGVKSKAKHKKLPSLNKVQLQPHRERVMLTTPFPPLPYPTSTHVERDCYTRNEKTLNLNSLLHSNAQLQVGNWSNSILPKLQELDMCNDLWYKRPLTKSWGRLHRKAVKLCKKLEEALMVTCKSSGWNDDLPLGSRKPLKFPLAKALHRWHNGGEISKVGDITNLCMPLVESLVIKTKHLALAPNGYVNVYFGKATLVKKQRGRGERRVPKGCSRVLGAHVVVCWLFNGNPINGQVCAHLCGHNNCINPHHLDWVDPWVNRWMQKWHKVHGRGNVVAKLPPNKNHPI